LRTPNVPADPIGIKNMAVKLFTSIGYAIDSYSQGGRFSVGTNNA